MISKMYRRKSAIFFHLVFHHSTQKIPTFKDMWPASTVYMALVAK